MHIYSPVFNGQNNFKRQIQMEIELSSRIKTFNEITLDIDFLHFEEVVAYFEGIFRKVIIENERNCDTNKKHIYIQSKDKKRLRKVQKTLRIYILKFSGIKMNNYTYYIEFYFPNNTLDE